MECLDDTTVLALVSGELGADDLARIDAHIDACGDCRAVVVTVAQGAASADSSAEAGELRRDAKIGRYLLGEVIGDGAMGVVRQAWDPELGRRVALKLLRAAEGLDPAEARDRLLREAQAMAKLSHPNVVTVYEVGAARDRVFLAMELVAGSTLRAWMGSERPWREVCDVMEQAGRGLEAAHAAGLVHRDVKPDNILIGADSRAKVSDFGLACSAAASPEAGARALAGTPAYMSPEALRGRLADAKSDQFSFCATFFEALHGERPFAGGSIPELRDAIAQGRVASTRRPAPAWLTSLLRRGLAERPEARHASMTALLDAIAARRKRPARWLFLAPAAALAIAALVLLRLVSAKAAPPSCDGGAAAVATVWGAAAQERVSGALSSDSDLPRVVAALDRWARRWAESHDETCRSHARGEQSSQLLDLRMRCLDRRKREAGVLVERLSRSDPRVAPRALDAAIGLPEPGECLDLDAAGVDPLPRDPAAAAAAGRALEGLADARAALLMGDPKQALALTRDLAGAAERSGHAPTRAEVDLVRAEALRMAGDARGAEDTAQASLSQAERGHDDVAAARAWLLLIALAGERRDLPAAEERARHAEAALGRAGDPKGLGARLDHARGLIYEGLGRYDDAERYLTAALNQRRALHGDDDLEVARSLAALGGVARAQGRLDEARERLLTALGIDERRLGPNHPDVARDLHNLGGVARMAGDLDGALQRYTRALEIRRAALGDDHVDTALTRNSIGLVYLARNHLDEAEQAFTAALVVLERARHGDVAIAKHNLGIVAQRRGDHSSALRLFGEAEALYRTTIGEDAEPMTRLREDREVSKRALSARVPPAPRPPAPRPPAPVAGAYGAPRPWDRN